MIPKPNEIPKFSDVLSIQSNPEDLFTLLDLIGRGAYGKVYKAIHKSTLQIFAVKIVDYTKDGLNNKNNINFQYNSLQEEASLMRLSQKNDNILKYYGSYYSRKSNTIWLILEYCSCGSLIDLMESIDRLYTEEEIATFIEMVLKGLIFLHDLNIIHRDIKCQNLLLTEDGCVKIADFGVGIKLTDEQYRHSKKGSPYWMSPQVASQQDYDIKTDIWSLGIACIELATHEVPFQDLKPFAIMDKIAKKPPKVEDMIEIGEYSKEFVDFLEKCIVVDPNKRFSAKQLIEHEFIKKYSKGKEFIKNLIEKHIDEIKNNMAEKIDDLKEKEKENSSKKINDSELDVTGLIEQAKEEYNENNPENDNEKIEIISDMSGQNEEENENENENNNLNNDNKEDKGNDSMLISDKQNEGIESIIENTQRQLDQIEVDEIDNDEEKEEKDYIEKKIEEMKNKFQKKIYNKKNKIKEQKKIKENHNKNISNMKTPKKKGKINLIEIENDKNDKNILSMNIIDEGNDKIRALLLNENNKNKELINSKYHKKRSERTTTGFTGSKTDSSDGKKFMNNKLIISEKKSIENNIYTKKKIDFINQDISNIEDDSDDEEIITVKQILNSNRKDNRLDKSYTEINYLKTAQTAQKVNRTKFLDKINICKYLNEFDINTQDDNNIVKNIHFSAIKGHNNYFN